MLAGVSDKTDYQTSTVDTWLAPEKPKIVVFIRSSDNQNTDLLSGVAAAIEAHDRQARVLIFNSDSEPGDELAADNIEFLQSMSGVVDYLLVDLPFRPTPFARSVLSDCDLVIVASSCKFDFLSEAEDIVKVLLFLGIAAEKVAGVVVDPEGILSSASLADIKPYLEASLGIEMAGVVSYGDDTGGQLDRDIEQLVRYIK
jgi:cellulose biosynthesis protein BcsQ